MGHIWQAMGHGGDAAPGFGEIFPMWIFLGANVLAVRNEICKKEEEKKEEGISKSGKIFLAVLFSSMTVQVALSIVAQVK